MNDIEVLPCPFCECSDILLQEKFTGSYRYGKPVYIAFLKCSLCEAATRSFSYIIDNEVEKRNSLSFAYDAWNRRGKRYHRTNSATWEVERDGLYHFAMCSACGKEIEYHGIALSTCPDCKASMEPEPKFFY